MLWVLKFIGVKAISFPEPSLPLPSGTGKRSRWTRATKALGTRLALKHISGQLRRFGRRCGPLIVSSDSRSSSLRWVQTLPCQAGHFTLRVPFPAYKQPYTDLFSALVTIDHYNLQLSYANHGLKRIDNDNYKGGVPLLRVSDHSPPCAVITANRSERGPSPALL